MLTIRELWTAVLDLLYPRRCIHCRRSGAWFCQQCIRASPRVKPPLCNRCGGAVDDPASQLCHRCRTAPLKIHRIRSVFYFEGPIRQAVHRFKYDGITSLAQPLGHLMADYWLTHPMHGDMIVPVPLHTQRLRQRGFNQAALLAHELSEQANLAMDDVTLVRHRATVSQVGLDIQQRRSNVRDAFRCTTRKLARRRVVLVDDVCTSGSTLEACAVALREGGAKRVQALTLARAR